MVLILRRAKRASKDAGSVDREGNREMKARVHITLKSGVLDPQGKAIGHALTSLGFTGVNDVRQGKVIELYLAETDKSRAEAAVKSMC